MVAGTRAGKTEDRRRKLDKVDDNQRECDNDTEVGNAVEPRIHNVSFIITSKI